jgi:hypothetical protein
MLVHPEPGRLSIGDETDALEAGSTNPLDDLKGGTRDHAALIAGQFYRICRVHESRTAGPVGNSGYQGRFGHSR